MQRNIRSRKKDFSLGAGSPQNQINLQVGADQPAKSNKRLKWVFGNLYECLSSDTSCQYRFSYGFGNYCAWFLKDNPVDSDPKPPCLSKEEHLKLDDLLRRPKQ